MWKLWVCTTSEPAETLPPLPPAPCNRYQVKCVLLQSWRGLTVGRWLESPFSLAILPLLLSLHLHRMFFPLQDVFTLKHGCSQGLNWGLLPSWVCWLWFTTLSVLIFSCLVGTQCHLLPFTADQRHAGPGPLILYLHLKDPFVLCDENLLVHLNQDENRWNMPKPDISV